MKRKIIKSAISRLSMARAAMTDFECAATVGEQREAWWRFLFNAAAVYEKLKAGAHEAGGASAPWFGRIKSERKKDPLLSYIHHARDTEYHGLEDSTVHQAASYGIHHPGGGMMFGIASASTSDSDATRPPSDLIVEASIDGKEVTPEEAAAQGFEFGVRPARLKLITVVDGRSGVSFDPPDMHLGKPIVGTDPLTVGRAALSYLENVVKAAESLVSD